MPLPPFQPSEPLTMGVELELQLVSLSDFDLVVSSTDILHLADQRSFPGGIAPELTESMIEITTGIHTRYPSLLEQLTDMRDALVRAGDTLNVGVSGGGTHPFQSWSDRKLYAAPRFKEVSALYGYLAKQFTVFGQHVHIGCESGDMALFLLHSLSRYVPHFIALSASSPYVQGIDTLYSSARLNSVFSFPLSGRAPFILQWHTFETDFFKKMEHTGVVKTMKDFYWDIRPKPEFGTIELRVCDTPLTVEKAAAIAAYLQLLCQYLLEKNAPPPNEDDNLVYNYNRFQACRFGLDGLIVHPQTHDILSLREDILTTLRHLEPYAGGRKCQDALDLLYQSTYLGNDAAYLRQAYTDSGSIEGMVEAAIQQFRQSTATPS